MNYVAGNDDSAIAPTQEHDRPREQRRKKRRKAMSIETRRPAKEEDNVSQKEDSNATIRPAKKRKRNQAVLEGMIVAVSTLDVKGESHSNSESSYKAVAECCRKLGASVTGQLHRRVSYLICNETAVNNATQRVRKAVKKKVPLVDVAWIRKCQENEELVDLDPYRLDNLAIEVIKSKRKETTEQFKEEGEVGCDEVLPDAKGAWTEPISYGCCCVCHENGDKNCRWCPDCS
jgi:hypothetical protein